MKGISIVLQKLLKYFNGTAICAFLIPSLLVASKNFDFLAHLCNISINFQLFLNNYQQLSHKNRYHNMKIFCIIYLCVTCFSYAVSERYTGFEYCLIIISVCFFLACAVAPAPTTVMILLKSIYPSL